MSHLLVRKMLFALVMTIRGKLIAVERVFEAPSKHDVLKYIVERWREDISLMHHIPLTQRKNIRTAEELDVFLVNLLLDGYDLDVPVYQFSACLSPFIKIENIL